MPVYVVNITISGGSDFEQTFYLEKLSNNNIKVRLDSPSKNPLNLTGYSGYAKLKKSQASKNTSANFSVSIPNPINGGVKISLGSSITTGLKSGRYCYDVLLSDGTVKTRAFEGSALLTVGITTI